MSMRQLQTRDQADQKFDIRLPHADFNRGKNAQFANPGQGTPGSQRSNT